MTKETKEQMKTIKELEVELTISVANDNTIKRCYKSIDTQRLVARIETLKDVLGLINELVIVTKWDGRIIKEEEIKSRIKG